MHKGFSRRQFLNTSVGALAGSIILGNHSLAAPFLRQSEPSAEKITVVRATKRTLDINGRAADVFGLLQPNGSQGLSCVAGELFNVSLQNELSSPTAIHWHGLHPPNNQDGVPGITQPVIRAGAAASYNFPVLPSGTHWMHSHQAFQEVQLLAAPLIVHDPADKARDEQEVVVLLSDYSFTPPAEIFAKLRQGEPKPAAGKMGLMKPDANDVNYDAYLANDRTLRDPEIVKVEKGGRVRLRIINSGSGTNFFIDLGSLTGELVATDGMPVRPIRRKQFPLAIAQRIDVIVQIPSEGGAFPILALRELATDRTGVVLATAGAAIPKLQDKGSSRTGLLNLDMERELTAVTPLKSRPVDVTSVLDLQGNMSKYQWPINGVVFDIQDPGKEEAQVHVKYGQRAAIKFVNQTPMSHPMHFHGHTFQVVAINDQPFSGALRDTILVPGETSVTVEFDANNPGLWFIHCHVLWHLAAGMAALVQYSA